MAHSSGDLLADRRLAYAAAATAEGDHLAAADILRQTMALVPDWAAGWLQLGLAEARLGDRAAALAALGRVAALDPADVLGARLHLARLGATPTAGASAAFVQGLFDQYADRFDTHLTEELGYRAPELLVGAVDRVKTGRFHHAIDLGCGTGLAGALFVGRCDRLDGVDLSPRMLAVARAKGLYNALHAVDIVAFLEGQVAGAADLLIAADVLVYIGDLAPVFAAAARALEAGGLFALTLQRGDDGYHVGDDMRFAHGPDYVAAVADAASFDIALSEHATSRRDAGSDVPGLVLVCRRR